jgi:hypothetical protein
MNVSNRSLIGKFVGTMWIALALAPGASTASDAVALSDPPAATNIANVTGSATLSWTAPTENTDGSALTNLSGFVIRYGTVRGALTQFIRLDTVGSLSYVVTDLVYGTQYYFRVRAVSSTGAESEPSAVIGIKL